MIARLMKKLTKDPTNKYKMELMNVIYRLRDGSRITQQQYDHIRPSGEIIPRLYATPKIHKAGNPLRPIVDYTGTILVTTFLQR